jgi:hypothetical protein
MPGNIGAEPPIRKEPKAQTDPLRNPEGIYSGPSKRVAIQDGAFAEVENMPKGVTSLGLGRRKK